jgi:outer membrane lipoprotein SlyB
MDWSSVRYRTQLIFLHMCSVRQRTDPYHLAAYPDLTQQRQEKNMKSTHSIAAIVLSSTALLSGCASTSMPADNSGGYASAAQSAGYGTIDSIRVTRGESGTSGAGAVVGGLLGALAGNQVGGGSGKAAATVAGAVGGAVVGNKIEDARNGDARDMYQISVRMDNGEYRTVVQDSVQDLRVGNRVRVVDGRAYRY